MNYKGNEHYCVQNNAMFNSLFYIDNPNRYVIFSFK